jgi:hypothetical protein
MMPKPLQGTLLRDIRDCHILGAPLQVHQQEKGKTIACVDESTITHHAQATWFFWSVNRYTYTKGYQATHPSSIDLLLQDEAWMTKSIRVPSENRNECHARILKGSRDATALQGPRCRRCRCSSFSVRRGVEAEEIAHQGGCHARAKALLARPEKHHTSQLILLSGLRAE